MKYLLIALFAIALPTFAATPGCMDTEAWNYDSTATVDDGSCRYYGCTDTNAANYCTKATDDDGSCTYNSNGMIPCMADGTCPCAGLGQNSSFYDSCMASHGLVEDEAEKEVLMEYIVELQLVLLDLLNKLYMQLI